MRFYRIIDSRILWKNQWKFSLIFNFLKNSFPIHLASVIVSFHNQQYCVSAYDLLTRAPYESCP